MSITSIASVVYGVSDVETSTRFFQDFGLKIENRNDQSATFRLPEGSSVVIRDENDPALPETRMVGPGVREVFWGVDGSEVLEKLAENLSHNCEVTKDPDGTVHFQTPFGIPMGLQIFHKKSVTCVPEPANAPGRIVRLNHPRRWRTRACPKGIGHVVFAIPEFEKGAAFMRERLNFRLSDEQVGFGLYLRAPGSNNHHNFLFLNADSPLPGMDGSVKLHHVNFVVEDLDEIMIGANHMTRCGWEPSHFGLGRHRIDSALFYYLPCPAGGEAEYGADSDQVDDTWIPRRWPDPLFAYSHFVHNLPPFLEQEPAWTLEYMTDEVEILSKFEE